jgi:hypothetical protein
VLIEIDGADPYLDRFVAHARAHAKKHKQPPPVAIEIREDDLPRVLGGANPLIYVLERLGGLIVFDDVEIRPCPHGIGKGRFMPIYPCRACSGGCMRCRGTGERRGSA